VSNPTSLLPPGFEQLEPFVAPWAIASSAGRDQRRSNSTESERVAFYEAAKDLAQPALAYLDRKPLTDFDESEKRLMDLILSLGHVALAVEAQGPDEARHASARRHMRITRSNADAGA